MRVVSARRAFLGCLAVAVLISAAPSGGRGAQVASTSPGVQLVPARAAYRAGQSIAVTVENRLRSQILRGMCFRLQRRSASRWVTVTRTHGISFPCIQKAGIPQPAGARAQVGLPLYDDLIPGEYRITLRYKPARGPNLGNLTGPHVRSVQARLRVLAFRPGPRPSLSERRILRLAERAARGSGDSHPSLIQHAMGTRFYAVLIGSGDLVFEWNWSYLIAARGHFKAVNASYPAGAKPPTGTVLTLVVDARTGRVTDGGIGRRYPPLAKLGHITTDLRAGRGTAGASRVGIEPKLVRADSE